MKKQLPIIILIKPNQSVGFGFTVITLDTNDNSIPKIIRNKENLTFEIQEINFDNNENVFNIAFKGKIIEDEKIKAKFVYSVKQKDYNNLILYFKNNTSIDKTSNSTQTIMLIKSILDFYDAQIFFEV